jgi:hypothetical protein
VKIRYGPYHLPKWDDPKGESKITGEGGMVDKTWLFAKKPCSDCLVTFIHAGLEFEDGSVANADKNVWMHHMDLFLMGGGRADLACGVPFGMELMFADGNERKPIVFGDKSKAGYYIRSGDQFQLVTELMNMAQKPQTAYITITFEYIPGKPKGFMNSRLLWMDVVGCGKKTSEIAPINDKEFVFHTKTWTSDRSGPMLSFAGHEHDGGSNVELYVNDRLICASHASYGETPGYVQKNIMGMEEMMHISGMRTCTDMGEIKKGDKVQVKAYYDFVKYPGLKTVSGKLDDVMGIGGLYIGQSL